MPATPERIHYVSAERTVEVTWDDGHVSRYPTQYLRGWCPCAGCQGHFARQYRYVENSGPELDDAQPVGGYGVRFVWSDGHGSGIYAFRELRALCPCCGGESIAGDPAARRARG